jgi:D-alanyl-D-alanine carboxypeptidase
VKKPRFVDKETLQLNARAIAAIGVVLLILLAACGRTGPEPTATPNALPDALANRLDAFLQSWVYHEGGDPHASAPGLILLVDTPDGRYLNAAGVGSLEDGTPMRVDDRVEIGSITKSFTVVLLMQLQEEGVLSLDDRLAAWLPDLAPRVPHGDEMTLRQLANHTSGIWSAVWAIVDEPTEDPNRWARAYSPEEVVQYAIDHGEPYFPPGEGWYYSDTGYFLLGLVAEEAAGSSLDELYRERIFEPLGLETAALIPGVPQEGEIAEGYWPKEDGTWVNTTDWNLSLGWAAGAMAMTAEDLLAYSKALSAGELFQNPDSLTEMQTFIPDGFEGMMPYGLGLIDFGTVAVPGYWGHGGQTPGFQTGWFTNPDAGITVIGLSNSGTFFFVNFLEVLSLLHPPNTINP